MKSLGLAIALGVLGFGLSACQTPMALGNLVPTAAGDVEPETVGDVELVVESTEIRASASALRTLFDSHAYHLSAVRSDTSSVPPIFTHALPPDMQAQDIGQKKDLFLRLMLPLVLEVNREISADRAYLMASGYQGPVDQAEDPRIRALAETYYARGDMDDLLSRVDVLPPALMLAQAVVESGWGTSRFAIEGQAIYGQWTWNDDDAGIVPSEREGDSNHRIRAFSSLLESTRAYALNLNRLAAYAPLRDLRQDMADAEKLEAGHALAAGLIRYSTEREVYIATLRGVMEKNALSDFGGAQSREAVDLVVVLVD